MSLRLPSPPTWIDLGGAPRVPGRLDAVSGPPRAGADVVAAITAAPRGRALLGGGEPTVRADLIDLLRAAPRGVGVRTDGLALVSGPVRQTLRRAGVAWLRIPLHSRHVDAHDWLVGQPGAGKRVLRVVREAARERWPVEVEITLTRPTLAHLPETVALVARLGVQGVWLRRLRAQGPAAEDWIALSPRLGQIRPFVEEAAIIAANQNFHLWIEGLPRCFLPVAEEHIVLADPPPAQPCPVCPGPPACGGVAQAYVDRFGWSEVRQRFPPADRQTVSLAFVPETPTRAVRQRLTLAARTHPTHLHLIGLTTHPDANELLRDALRLSIPRVTVEGPLGMLGGLSDRALFRLRGLAEIRVTERTPEAEAFQARAAGVVPVVLSLPSEEKDDSPDLQP